MTGYGNRGMSFESLIEYANTRYRHEGIAIIEKQHTLCKPLRNGTGAIVSAKYEEKATVDFMGRYGGRPIAFEAKHCATGIINLKRVETHQCEFLRDWTKNPEAIGYILVSFYLSRFFLIPWNCWEAALSARRAKEAGTEYRKQEQGWKPTGKASISITELPEEWEVTVGGKYALDYLAAVRRIWKAG